MVARLCEHPQMQPATVALRAGVRQLIQRAPASERLREVATAAHVGIARQIGEGGAAGSTPSGRLAVSARDVVVSARTTDAVSDRHDEHGVLPCRTDQSGRDPVSRRD